MSNLSAHILENIERDATVLHDHQFLTPANLAVIKAILRDPQRDYYALPSYEAHASVPITSEKGPGPGASANPSPSLPPRRPAPPARPTDLLQSQSVSNPSIKSSTPPQEIRRNVPFGANFNRKPENQPRSETQRSNNELGNQLKTVAVLGAAGGFGAGIGSGIAHRLI